MKRREFLKTVGAATVAVAMPAVVIAAAEAMVAPAMAVDYAAWLRDKIEAHVLVRGFEVIRPEPFGEPMMVGLGGVPEPDVVSTRTRLYVPLLYTAREPDGEDAEWGMAATFWTCFCEDYDAFPGDLYWRQTPRITRERNFEDDIVYVKMMMRCSFRQVTI